MRLALSDGAYEAKSIIASAQRCVNLYSEQNPGDAPFPTTHYLTPGTLVVLPGITENAVRCTFRASNGEFFFVVGDTIYYADAAFVTETIGTIDPGTTPVSMQDNGLVVLICDGTVNLYAIDLSTHDFATVTGSNVYGSDRVDYVDTFFLLNIPNTNEWYISLSEINFEMLTGVVGSIVSGAISFPGDSGAIATGTITSTGTGYNDGTFTNIALTGGTGSGATAHLTISAGLVTTATINFKGINYTVGDVLTISATSLSIKASGTYTFNSGIPLNTETIILNGTTWTFVTSGATGNQTNIGVDLAATLTQLAIDLNASSNGGIAVATYTVSPTVLTILYKTAGTAGNAYTLAAGTYAGSISGGTLAGGVDGTGSGFQYTVLTTEGSYTNGTYPGVALTGGSGTGAVATIVVSNRVVSSVTLTTHGSGYVVGDVLSANTADIGGGQGTGFAYTVLTIGGGAFDSLDIATKNGYPDAIMGIIVMHREVWIIGTLTSEIWYNAGTADFPFQVLPGTFIEHGCIAKYSIAKQDLSVYWLSQDEQGQAIVIRGTDYTAKRISTFAIENEFATYGKISDAIGFTYQQEGHVFYVLTFPYANKTWVFDQAAGLWHQRAWTDNNGILNRHRMNCAANAYNMNIVGDWENGNLYKLDLNTYVDNIDGEGLNEDGSYPISRIRSWPALVNEGKRVVYQAFTADMQVGDDDGIIDGSTTSNPPLVSLRWSDDRGRTYGNAVEQSIGAQGQYLTQANWNRLGMGRGRVFELSWSIPASTALNGAWIQTTQAGS